MRNLLEKLWFRVILILILSLFIAEIGSSDSLARRLRTSDFYKEYIATVVIGLVALEFVYFVNSRLDAKVPWSGNIIYRLFLQTVFGWVTPIVLIVVLATFYFSLYGVDIRRTDYFYFALPFAMFLLLVLNLLLVIMPYLLFGIKHMNNPQGIVILEDQQAPSLIETQERIQIAFRIKIRDGMDSAYLDASEIAAVYIVNTQVMIKNIEEEEYLTDLSLDELEKDYLPASTFFRINRQLIVRNTVCKSYTPLKFGKIEVELTIRVPVDTIVSQLKSHTYKYWIENQG